MISGRGRGDVSTPPAGADAPRDDQLVLPPTRRALSARLSPRPSHAVSISPHVTPPGSAPPCPAPRCTRARQPSRRAAAASCARPLQPRSFSLSAWRPDLARCGSAALSAPSSSRTRRLVPHYDDAGRASARGARGAGGGSSAESTPAKSMSQRLGASGEGSRLGRRVGRFGTQHPPPEGIGPSPAPGRGVCVARVSGVL
jgi:hypothetical protein